jgi:membrane-associated phospholipid phosphatase
MDPSQAFLYLAQILDNPYSFFAIIGIAIFLSEPRWNKRGKIVLALLIAGLMALLAKNLIMEPRPCVGGDSLIQCPLDYSLPSGHAAIAFTLMIAFIGKRSFIFYWLFALLVAYSRFYLGVHTFEDLAAALVLAPIAYQFSDIIWGAFVERGK